MMTNTEKIKIITEYIELQQLLKKVNVVASGGEVKSFLSSHSVLVDGEEETRRGRKLYPGCLVEVLGKSYLITK